MIMHRNHAIKISAIYGFLGCALVLVATSRYGIGLSADSVTYLAASQNILEGRGYNNFDGAPVLAFPPMFSTTIAVLSAGLFDPAGVARFINALCFGLVVFLTANWFFRHLRSNLLALLGTTSVFFSTTLIGISVYAWSEPLFLVLTMLMFLQLERADSTDSLASCVLAGIFASLAILDRYAGITVVMTGAILLAAKSANSIVSLVRQLFIFLSIAVLPISLWFYRNYEISSTITGYRVESAGTFIQSGYDIIKVVSSWFLPESIPVLYRLYGIILLTIIFLLIVFVVPRISRSRNEKSPKTEVRAYARTSVFGDPFNSIFREVMRISVTIVDIKEIIPFLVFTFIYALFMIYTTSTTALSEIDNRYMSPIFTPLILSVFYLIDRLVYKYSVKTGNTLPRSIIATCLVVWLIYPIFTTYKTVKANIEQGAGGFHTSDWAESDLISYIKSSELSGTIYTNEPSAVYALTGQVYKPSPEKFGYGSQVPTDDLLRFQADLQSQSMLYIVWFNTDWWKGYLYDIDDLKNICELEKIVTRKDGDVYRMRLSDCQPLT